MMRRNRRYLRIVWRVVLIVGASVILAGLHPIGAEGRVLGE